MTKHGAAYDAVRIVYDQSPGRSWLRLNGALHGTLMAAITAYLSFERGDFNAMRCDMNGGYWMGNSHGSVCGESFYVHAVKVGHTPACLSFEDYAERPPALWSETVKTPERLCLGSEFSWEGLQVKVTNMTSEHLIACHYSGDQWSDELKVGSAQYFKGSYRIVKSLKSGDDGSVRVAFSAPIEQPERKPSRRFTITYAQLAEQRKVHDTERKTALASINSAASEPDLAALGKSLSAARAKYRPFDIQDFAKAFRERMSELRKAAA